MSEPVEIAAMEAKPTTSHVDALQKSDPGRIALIALRLVEACQISQENEESVAFNKTTFPITLDEAHQAVTLLRDIAEAAKSRAVREQDAKKQKMDYESAFSDKAALKAIKNSPVSLIAESLTPRSDREGNVEIRIEGMYGPHERINPFSDERTPFLHTIQREIVSWALRETAKGKGVVAN